MKKDNLKTLVIDGEKTFFKMDEVLNELMASFTEEELMKFLNRTKQRTAEAVFKEIEKPSIDLGLKESAKRYPDFVNWIVYNYVGWQKLKQGILKAIK